MNRIGRYRIDDAIGAGSFATVFAAFDESLDAEVAVKVLADNWARDPDVRYRFINEARLLRRHANPALVAVFDIGETEDGRPYFVMERADESVADRLEAGATADRSEVGRIVEMLVTALGVLHEAGVVHRDISPGNLLVRGGGRAGGLLGPGEEIALGDLGLAKELELASGMTVSGGTRGYMAPEQQRVGATVSPASDIYSASALVCRLLTGSPPDPDGKLNAEQRGRLGAGLSAALARGLAPDPGRRPGSIEEWGNDVIGALEDGLTPESRSPRWQVRASIALAVLAAAAVIVWAAMPSVSIEGPGRIDVGVRSTYTAVADDPDSLYWTDWNGNRVDGSEFWIEPSSPGTLTFMLTAVNEDGSTTIVERTVVVDEP